MKPLERLATEKLIIENFHKVLNKLVKEDETPQTTSQPQTTGAPAQPNNGRGGGGG